MFNEKDYILEIIKNQIYCRSEDWKHGQRPGLYESAMDLFWNQCIEDGIMNYRGVKIPDIRWFHGWHSWPVIYGDSILIHHLLNDEYTFENSSMIESVGGEGPYFLDDVIVKRGDVLIDAGAFVGDFSAVAAERGAKVYAFEPSSKATTILRDTAILNNFTVVEEGLGDEVRVSNLLRSMTPGCDSILNTAESTTQYPQSTESCKINTIDNFSKCNDLHIGFIKSDIEGFERYMLKGATNVLINQEPDLAIRIYHNQHEDKKVIPKLILDINPNYRLTYGLHRQTVFATVKR
jgi:FkbM family methyltransferase